MSELWRQLERREVSVIDQTEVHTSGVISGTRSKLCGLRADATVARSVFLAGRHKISCLVKRQVLN